MARKKKSDEVVEDIQVVVTEEVAPEVVEESTVEEVVEEKPKAKRGRKAKVEETAVEEAPVEEPTVEEVSVVESVAEESIVEETPTVEEIPESIAEPIIEEVKEELIVKETPKVKKAKAAEKVEEPAGPYVARVNSIITHSRRGPGMAFPIARTLNKGIIVHISEVNGNWGKISQNTWININYVDKI